MTAKSVRIEHALAALLLLSFGLNVLLALSLW
jgi:hypothetical protein